MNRRAYRRRNNIRRVVNRVIHPWPFYHRGGGINAVVTRADGTKIDLGRVSDTYTKRWGVGTNE